MRVGQQASFFLEQRMVINAPTCCFWLLLTAPKEVWMREGSSLSPSRKNGPLVRGGVHFEVFFAGHGGHQATTEFVLDPFERLFLTGLTFLDWPSETI